MAKKHRPAPKRPAQPAPVRSEIAVAVEEAPPPGTALTTKLSASAGIVAAMVLAVVVNILAARHYTRWDWTRGGLYTLSSATVETLRSLEAPVTVHVMLAADDPLSLSLQHLLRAYQAETSRIAVQVADPDANPAEFIAVQQKYGIVPGRSDDGRIVSDAALVVAHGERHHFITSRDLVQVEDEEDLRARPRLEQAVTGAIRSVLGGDKLSACFATGHGEKALEAGTEEGLSPLRDRLIKNNFEIVQLPPHASLGTDKDPLPGCRLLVIAGPTERLPAEDVARFRRFVEGGGSMLLAAGPVPDTDDKRYLDLGLDDLLGVAGVEVRDDFVFELDAKQRMPQGFGESFRPVLKPHPITEGLLRRAELGSVGIAMTVASSLGTTGKSAAIPAPLLTTSDQAFGMVDFFGWAQNPTAPAAKADDHKGPLVLAYAAELPKPLGSTAANGPRVVLIGSTSLLVGTNWTRPDLRGGARFVENAISWLTARPEILDIPNKPSFVAGMHLSEEDLAAIFRKVVVYIPLASALLGVAVYLRRRGGERRGRPGDGEAGGSREADA